MPPVDTSVVILIPVLRRPHRVQPLMDDIEAATPEQHRVLFIATDTDAAEIAALQEAGAQFVTMPPSPEGDYAKKINYGASVTTEPFIFTAADDLHFHPFWCRKALAQMRQPRIGVVGTNDLGNPRTIKGYHSTHTLFRRTYMERWGTIDEKGKIYHEGYPHEYCNPPEARVWMGDLSFKSLGDVVVGDVVVGWERGPNLRPSRSTGEGSYSPRKALARSAVLAVNRRRSEIVRVELESGRSLRCTPDHRWLNGYHQTENHPSHFVTPKVGRHLSWVCDEPSPLDPSLERLAGWLGGIYDGEGSWIQIAHGPTANPEICAAIITALNKLDIPHTVGRTAANLVTLTGGRQAYLEFLHKCQPVKAHQIVNKIIGGKRFGVPDRIVAVEPDGEGEVVSMMTSTGNYVAWGYASRNCDDEAIKTAQKRRAFISAHDSHVEHLHPNWDKAPWDDVYEGQEDRQARGRVIFMQRHRLWD